MKRSLGRTVVFSGVLTGALAVLTVVPGELLIEYMLNNGEMVPGALLNPLREYDLASNRRIVQYDPACARYDSRLGYTLRPGECRMTSREYETALTINSMGVRDDESSLDSPEIIVAGDSHAMGWGVDERYLFSTLLEQRLALKTINAAVPSYGTVREMQMLNRIKLDRLKYLIVQYCDNDAEENGTFRKNGNKLPRMTQEDYDAVVRYHAETSGYYFGKHLFHLSGELLRRIRSAISSILREGEPAEDAEVAARDEADAFLNALRSSPVNLKDVVILVFEVNGFARNDSLFINAVRQQLQTKWATQPWATNIRTLNLSRVLDDTKYFTVDDHINKRGHEAVTEALVDILDEH